MKAKFLPFLLLAVLLQVSTFSFADEMISAREIRLKNKTKVQHRSIPVTPEAFIENSLLSIDLLSTVPVVTVNSFPASVPVKSSIFGIIVFIESVYSLSFFIASYACIPM